MKVHVNVAHYPRMCYLFHFCVLNFIFIFCVPCKYLHVLWMCSHPPSCPWRARLRGECHLRPTASALKDSMVPGYWRRQAGGHAKSRRLLSKSQGHSTCPQECSLQQSTGKMTYLLKTFIEFIRVGYFPLDAHTEGRSMRVNPHISPYILMGKSMAEQWLFVWCCWWG